MRVAGGTLHLTGDFGRHLTLHCPFPPSVHGCQGKNDSRLSPPVCWLIYCSPTRRWEINWEPSVRHQYNKWPIQSGTRSLLRALAATTTAATAGALRQSGDEKKLSLLRGGAHTCGTKYTRRRGMMPQGRVRGGDNPAGC